MIESSNMYVLTKNYTQHVTTLETPRHMHATWFRGHTRDGQAIHEQVNAKE